MSDDSLDLSWVTFLDEDPRDECINPICRSSATWILYLGFECRCFPNVQPVCQGHRDYIVEFFEADNPDPALCHQCRKPVELLDVKPNRL